VRCGRFTQAGQSTPRLSPTGIADGEYNTASVDIHGFVVDGLRCGFVKAFDLDDGTPLFDLRVATAHRPRHRYRAALAWLIAYLFTSAKHQPR
jgi:hypothetical protein